MLLITVRTIEEMRVCLVPCYTVSKLLLFVFLLGFRFSNLVSLIGVYVKTWVLRKLGDVGVGKPPRILWTEIELIVILHIPFFEVCRRLV